MDETRTCWSETHCKAYDTIAKRAAETPDPLCTACLEAAGRDTRALVYDYLDLAQLHEASMSQAIAEKTGGSKEKRMLLVAHIEALQAEIVHVTTTWETEVRVATRLTLGRRLPVPAWSTTLSYPLPRVKVRAGTAVQRAVGILTPRVRLLSLLPATTVCPTGIEDDPADMAGWEAVHHLQTLHGRAKSALGRTRRTFWIPGECWACDAKPTPGVDGPLCRSEPHRYEDPMQVVCDHCHATRPYPDYEEYMATAGTRWPGQADVDAQVAA